ncbi:protein tyrosine phosphatase [Variovorax sp. YR216]|uniref:arsenate reductase/protein-tyrosine-phosphatase family protein n=1 Tax=Variovorax sp. YR216 TaxID=1882828 RepID=UPI0008956214|nr:protein tyrosine phosphatase [Variovorax sp. YR216]SEA55435.1 Protein-tyrosine-phosphatase [Variovorax sp. YR216]
MKTMAQGQGSIGGTATGARINPQRFVVFFVSRRCSLRSVLAEACLTHLCEKRFAAYSCGDPHRLEREIHPAAVRALASASIPLRCQPRQNWNDLSSLGAPKADFVITLDEDTLARQPRWPGQPNSALWALSDIAEISDPEALAHASIQTLHVLRRRLELLVNLPLRSPDRAAFQMDVRDMAFML